MLSSIKMFVYTPLEVSARARDANFIVDCLPRPAISLKQQTNIITNRFCYQNLKSSKILFFTKRSRSRLCRQARSWRTTATLNSEAFLVTLKRPLGIFLAENSDNGKIFVEELVEGGTAALDGGVQVGDFVEACGSAPDALTVASTFDLTMDVLAGSPEFETMTLKLIRPVVEKEVPANPVLVEVVSPSGTTQISLNPGDVLRNVLLENNVELYNNWGKIMNCGGGGSCGTCVVEVLEGADQLSAKEGVEVKLLKKKPENYRLACQTVCEGKGVGNLKIAALPK